MSKRVTPSERLRAEVDEVFAGGADLATAIEQVARIGARLLLQTALEAEATEFLGRERYARAASSDNARAGSRNGYGETTIKTTAGPVTLSRPKLRGTSEVFTSRLLGTGVTKTHALESLVIAGFVLANLFVIALIAGVAYIGLAWVAGLLWFLLKTYVFVFIFVWMRGTLPRVRIDQLMDFAWKWMLPASLFNLALTAAARGAAETPAQLLLQLGWNADAAQGAVIGDMHVRDLEARELISEVAPVAERAV